MSLMAPLHHPEKDMEIENSNKEGGIEIVDNRRPCAPQ